MLSSSTSFKALSPANSAPVSRSSSTMSSRRESRASRGSRRGSSVNILINEVMQSLEISRATVQSQQTRKSFFGVKSPRNKSITPTLDGSGNVRKRSTTLNNIVGSKGKERVMEFMEQTWTGSFASRRAESEYADYRARGDSRSLRVFSVIVIIFTTFVLAWNVLAGRHIGPGVILLQVASVLVMVLFVSIPERLLIKPLLFGALYALGSGLSIASRVTLDERIGIFGFALMEVYHYTAGILFASFKQCLLFTLCHTPAFIFFINDLGTAGGAGEDTFMYTGLAIFAEFIFLWLSKTIDDRSRKMYSMVIFISTENKQNEIQLKREKMFNNSADEESADDSDDDDTNDRRDEMNRASIKQSMSSLSTASREMSRSRSPGNMSRSNKEIKRMQRASGFSRDVFIHSDEVDIIEETGRGSFGVVYRAVWHDTVVCVKHLTEAAKIAEEEFFKEFSQEARLMSNLRHPNIVMFMGVIIEADFVGLVTEFCFEGNVSDVIVNPDNEANLQAHVISRMITDTCRGMNFLHLHTPPIIHRDLKGSNILVDDNWHCKVADFGLSQLQNNKQLAPSPDDALINPHRVGTIMWAAPEILVGGKLPDEKSDVYSFGVVLFEFLYKESPYHSVDPKSVVYLVSQGKRPDEFTSEAAQARILHLDDSLVPLLKLMKRCWAEDATKRPSFHDILERLEEEAQAYKEIFKFDANATTRRRKQRNSGGRRGSISSTVDKGKFHLNASEITIGKKLGTGSFGEVYEGAYFGTPVAVKELFANKLSDDLIVEFTQECNLFKDMRHPNIVLFMGSAFDAPKLYMVMELCEYGSVMNLYTNIEKPEEMSVLEGKALDLANDICQGGSYLHRHDPPIIHRDLKSENVLVDSNFVAKITDFGQSRFQNDGGRTMTACGSPLWTAPEVIRGEKYSEKADVYSFAIILYELLTWSPPYPNDNPHFVMMKVASEGYRMTISDEFDPFFHKILTMSWHADPAERPSFEGLHDMIEECHKETSLMKFKGDWRDTMKTFRVTTMRRANSKKKGKNDPGSPLFAEAPKRRGSISADPGALARKSDSGRPIKNRIAAFREKREQHMKDPNFLRKSIALQAAEASDMLFNGTATTFKDFAKMKRSVEEEV